MVETVLKSWTAQLANWVEVVAALLIGLAAIEAVARLLVYFLRRHGMADATEDVRLRLGRWLTLALEFELAADVVRTAVAPDWTQIGQLAAIATIRTLLNYFLRQEVDQVATRPVANPLMATPLSASNVRETNAAE
ncbi:MAG: DUF1622 domain-containing protein [Ktedonobacterales bacterium]|nr:DUF1622 domain-containing protein [Ktedonobacterales bacterium]